MRTVDELGMKCIVAAMKGVYCILKLLPVQKKAVFISRQTDETPVDFRLIIEELESRKCGWKTVVLAKRLRKSAAGIVGYGFHTLRQMYHIATARVVLVDGYCIPVSVLSHKENLKIIQIWHAMGCMKKFGYAMIGEEEGSSEDVARIMKMHRNYDYALISSYSFVRDYIEGFRIEREKIVQIPLPKADLLISEEYLRNQRDKLTGKHHVLAEKRNILYCPTFRKDETTAGEGIRRLIDEIDFGRYNLIYNPHPNSRVEVNDPRVMILPYPTMELLAVADCVISDYSSVIYEAGLAKKPVYLYGYDWKEYSRKRAFNLDITKDVPTLFTDNPGEILKAIDDDDFDHERFSEFIDRNVVMPEGGCTSAIADLILGRGEKEIDYEGYNENHTGRKTQWKEQRYSVILHR